MRGRVANLIRGKNFGFIKGDDRVHYFFHRADFNGFFSDLMIDFFNHYKYLEVEFTPVREAKGWRATDVFRLDDGVRREPIEMPVD